MNTLEVSKERIKKEKAYKTMLLLGMASVVMIFAGLTSAYVVSSSRPDWLNNLNLPSAFLYSTIIMLISSFTFHMAKVRTGVVLADVLGHDAAAGGTLAFVLAVIAEFPMVRTAEERIA